MARRTSISSRILCTQRRTRPADDRRVDDRDENEGKELAREDMDVTFAGSEDIRDALESDPFRVVSFKFSMAFDWIRRRLMLAFYASSEHNEIELSLSLK